MSASFANYHSKSGNIKKQHQSLNVAVGTLRSIGHLPEMHGGSSSIVTVAERETNVESNPLLRSEATQIKEFALSKYYSL